jgi:UTP--glucose-1-phosphate uridylyltransferase
MSIDVAIEPVAGRGTRLLPLTKSQPKEMLPLGRKPTVQHVVEELAHAGVRRLLFITGPGKTAIENHFDIDPELIDHLRHGGKEELLAELEFQRETIAYSYTRQPRQLGLGHAVLCARPFVGDGPFFIALGDSIIGHHGRSTICQRMQEQFAARDADAVIAFQEVPREEVVHYGIAKPRGEAGEVFDLEDLVEKPDVQDAPSRLAVAARYVCRESIFDLLENTPPGRSGEIHLTDALRQIIRQGGRVVGVRLADHERRYDVGNFAAYFEAMVDCALDDPDYGPALRTYLERRLNETARDGTP